MRIRLRHLFGCLPILLLFPQVGCASNYPLAKVTVQVVNQDGNPVTNAKIQAAFYNGEELSGYPDKNGFISFCSPVLGDMVLVNDKGDSSIASKYYPTLLRRFYWRPSENAKDGKWQPWNPTITMVLRERKHPIPMYATLNLRNANHKYTGAANNPLRVDTDDTVYFLHGYSVSESDADEWFETIFKRLWQSGLNMNFCGVTWNGNEGTLDYYKNVENAFTAAGRLNTALKDKDSKNQTVILAHSLGNMVVSSMLQDYSTPVNSYFMLNAAVPAEAYDDPPTSCTFDTTTVPKGLIHDEWSKYPAKTWAAFWHRHFFPTEDYTPTEADVARSTLTWKGRFKDVLTNRGVTVYNYYSAGGSETRGDEVFELLNETPEPTTNGFARHSWQKQECYKGRKLEWYEWLNILNWSSEATISFVASNEMGWEFDADDQTLSQAKGNELSAEKYRETPIFKKPSKEILGADATAIVAKRDHLLAYGIPAMTEATGRSSLPALFSRRQEVDCQTEYVSNVWTTSLSRDLPGRWLHSDLKDLDYPYLRTFYKSIVERMDQE